EVALEAGMLLIADGRRPLALAGIMGGRASAVVADTCDVFLESAYFRPETIAWSARRLGIMSDAAHRFERGVDPELPAHALARTTQLLMEIAGGVPGPVRTVQDRAHLPVRDVITVREARVRRVLGAAPSTETIDTLLRRLDPRLRRARSGWRLQPPSHRFDLRAECDLVEEIARGWGYDQIPAAVPQAPLRPAAAPVTRLEDHRIRHALQARGYQEVVTYSFVDPALERFFDTTGAAPQLANPLTQQWAVLRTSLNSGLLMAAAHNRRRQQERLRLFEVGRCFGGALNGVEQRSYVGFLALGACLPRQWGVPSRTVDLFDLKADLAALQALGHQRTWDMRPAELAGFHPTQAAEILQAGRVVGQLGTVHPEVVRFLGLEDNIVLCNIELNSLLESTIEQYVEISRFPWVKRDLALVVRETVPVGALIDTVREVGGGIVEDIEVFDEYRGEHIDSGRKSLGLTLTLQDSSRTLTEENVEAVVTQITAALLERYEARLRQ
ncbi:MAG TPA: phenylalanine--tRNA ligase subunit beta, partial [Acidiferrobacteraceae bacterium]|nr:phenylalanine--tRNA ligase subunit beta [Acidiferrobacteraceae bacterium]